MIGNDQARVSRPTSIVCSFIAIRKRLKIAKIDFAFESGGRKTNGSPVGVPCIWVVNRDNTPQVDFATVGCFNCYLRVCSRTIDDLIDML